jgi:hypothetical protein
MTPLFTKLNLGAHREILVLSAPASFETELNALSGVTVHRDPSNAQTGFLIAFVFTLAEVNAAAALMNTLVGDPVVWLAYPKATSKRYQCEFNRDTGWTTVGDAGFEGVRQVAIDADWSALRFRRTEFIKSLTRDASRALSASGRKRLS